MLIWKALDRLFRVEKVSPTDVTEHGRNLLHYAAKDNLGTGFATFWSMLASLGVPEDSLDDENRSVIPNDPQLSFC